MGMDPERAESVGAGDRGTVRWYCVQTRPKSEHIAAAGLARFDGVEAYCPRIRYQKVTRRGKVWFREALFPNYIFARFDAEESLRAVSSSQAVVRVVGFGDVLGEVPAAVLDAIHGLIAFKEDKPEAKAVEPVPLLERWIDEQMAHMEGRVPQETARISTERCNALFREVLAAVTG